MIGLRRGPPHVVLEKRLDRWLAQWSTLAISSTLVERLDD
jgi:hypothetical protein